MGVVFGQLLVAVLNPPADKFGFIAVVVVVDVALVNVMKSEKREP